MSEEFEVLDEEQEMYEHYRFVVDKGQSLLRIDKYLMNRIEGVSRSKIQAAANAGNILVNKNSVKPNYKVKPCDIISIVLAQPPREIELIPQNIPINIVYEDDDIIIINKEPGMVVHPGYGNYTGTLVNALIYHFQQSEKNNENVKPFLVHRIDKNTSGIILVAKNEIAQAKLAKEFFDHTIKRKYHALVWGDFKEEEGTITGNIARSLKDRKIMAVFQDEEIGRSAITHYRVLERFGYITLIECQLETGRTHQIRVHMKYAGHPLFNDETYGGDYILKGTTFSKYKQFIENCFNILPRQALHAKSLGFKHPATGEEIFFDSDLPHDMQAVIVKWRKYISDKKNEFEE
ncbi:MAG TPA: RluA family pseudouridine synthase [Bacteroidales bacterium]|nr:RluA family pseudouridine synthase [Bacteroidales bacterium]HPS15928.1 RluA family pseudouridine synthase [Bacteroidales bacterium]